MGYLCLEKKDTKYLDNLLRIMDNSEPLTGPESCFSWCVRCQEVLVVLFISSKARFPLGDFFRANKQKANVIGW